MGNGWLVPLFGLLGMAFTGLVLLIVGALNFLDEVELFGCLPPERGEDPRYLPGPDGIEYVQPLPTVDTRKRYPLLPPQAGPYKLMETCQPLIAAELMRVEKEKAALAGRPTTPNGEEGNS